MITKLKVTNIMHALLVESLDRLAYCWLFSAFLVAATARSWLKPQETHVLCVKSHYINYSEDILLYSSTIETESLYFYSATFLRQKWCFLFLTIPFRPPKYKAQFLQVIMISFIFLSIKLSLQSPSNYTPGWTHTANDIHFSTFRHNYGHSSLWRDVSSVSTTQSLTSSKRL